MSELLRLSLVDLVATLRERRASPVELMNEVFDAVDVKNPTLNAVVAERDRAALMEDARAAEARLSRGDARPLEGVPFGVKDLEDAAGLPTTYGSKPFVGNVATRDSTQVARLRAAGAVVFGKTNTPEFGTNAITKNLVFGETRSPWNPAHSPGGSSGGSAAALAGEMLPLVTSSDGGGSVRIPASFVGAFGLKPSFGRVPRGPFRKWFHGDTVCYGPITKTVADAALFLDVVAGYDAHDPTSLPSPTARYADVVERPLEKLRIAVSPDLGYAVVQSDVAQAFEETVLLLEKHGHTVSRLRGGPPEMNGEWGLLSAFEIASDVSALRPEKDGEFGRALLETFRYVESMSQPLWGSMMEKRARIAEWCATVFADHDVLVTPTVPYDPPPARGPFPSETEGRPQITAGVASFTIPFNLSWHPAATVRMGLSRQGLPMGFQIVAPHHREDLALQVARSLERERPWHPSWPMR